MATDANQVYLFVGLALLVLLPIAGAFCCFCRLKKLGTYNLTKRRYQPRHGHGKHDSDSDPTTVPIEDTSNSSKRDYVSFIGMKKTGSFDETPHVLSSAYPKRMPQTRYVSWPPSSFSKPLQRPSLDFYNSSATDPPESLRSPESNTISVLHHHSFDYEPVRCASLTLKLSAPTAKPKAADCNTYTELDFISPQTTGVSHYTETDVISDQDSVCLDTPQTTGVSHYTETDVVSDQDSVCLDTPQTTQVSRYTKIDVISDQDSVCLDTPQTTGVSHYTETEVVSDQDSVCLDTPKTTEVSRYTKIDVDSDQDSVCPDKPQTTGVSHYTETDVISDQDSVCPDTPQTTDGTDPGLDINEALNHIYSEIIDCDQTWNQSESGSEAISLRPWSRQGDNAGSARREYEAEMNNSLPVTAQHSQVFHISDQQEAFRWNGGDKGSVGVYSSIEVVSHGFGLSLPRSRADFGDSGLELDASNETLPVHDQDLSALDKDLLAQDKRLPVPDQDLSAQDHSSPVPDRDLSALDQNLPVPGQDSYSGSESEPVFVENVSSYSGDSSTLDGTDRDSSCGGDAEPVYAENVSTASGDSSTLDGTDRDSICGGDAEPVYVENVSTTSGDIWALVGTDRDTWWPACGDVHGDTDGRRVADGGFYPWGVPFLNHDDWCPLTTSSLRRHRNSFYNDDAEDSSTQNHDNDDVEDSNIQQSQKGSEFSESNGEDLQAQDIDEADTDPSYGVVPGRDLSLTKETLEYIYVNLIDTYTTSVSTQTPPHNKNAPRPPCFSPGWQFSKEMTSVGGCLQGDDSDVRLEVPAGAIPAEEYVTIRGAISVDIGKVYRKLQLEEFEFVASPIAEYDTGKSFRFETPVQLFLPHFLPKGFSPKNVNVYQFTCDQFGNIAHQKLQLREKEINSEKGDAEDRDATQLEGFCFDKDGQICILTTHFSGYVCTHCGRELPHPTLHMDLYASHEEKARGGRQVKVRLEVWDNRLFIKDFRESLRTTATWRQGQELNRSNLVLMDRKTLPALAADVDVTEVVAGFRLEVLSEDDVCDWEHKKRPGRDELCFPEESTMELKLFVPCACQSHIPQVVDWLLTARPNASLPVSDVFECLVDVGYVSCVDRNSNVPVRFLPEPRHVTIHASVSKTTVQQRSSEDVNNNAGFPELEHPSWISNDLSAVRPNQFSQTQRKMELLAPPSTSDHRRGQSSPACPHPCCQSHGGKMSHVCSGHQNVSGLCQKTGIEQESHVSVCQHPRTFCAAADPRDVTGGGSEHDARSVAAESGTFSADSGSQPQGKGPQVLIQKLGQLVINSAPESPRPPSFSASS